MASLSEKLRRMAGQAPGRCHSCIHQHTYDLPSGTRYWCRAYNKEMTAEERDTVKDCSRWQPLRVRARIMKTTQDPLIRPHLDAEDSLFWQLSVYLQREGLDLRTMMMLAHGPALRVEKTDWIDGLEDRFSDEELRTFPDVIQALRDLGYNDLCDLVEKGMQGRA